ncbi:DNA cytosine methyltransferase [Agrobacterium rosae]|uniref:DNA cytosine methyltransferase n=1 Tax=Agrobacterium rosae TaxID=1972867 RepID=UPI003BA14A24
MTTNQMLLDQKAKLSKVANKLISINKEITKLYVDAALCFDDLAGLDTAQVQTFLSMHANMSLREIEQLQKTAAILSPKSSPFSIHRELLIGSGISIAAINEFAEATEVAQRETIRLLSKSNVLRADEVKKVRDADRECARSEASRKAVLNAYSTDVTERKIERLERQSESIALDLQTFQDSWDHGEFDEDEELHAFCHKKLATAAAEAIALYIDVFGDAHTLLDSSDVDARQLAAPYFALRQLADGKFGMRGGLDLLRDIGEGRLSLLEALSPLLTHEAFPAGTDSRLEVLELCAGAGGMAIGLQAAGFKHVALFDKHNPAVETLRHNQPHWPVTKIDVRTLGEKELSRFRNVDLFAAGLPCMPGAKLSRRADLYPKMIDIIRMVAPKAFILECDAGARERHPLLLRRAGIVNSLTACDYTVAEFPLDTKEFGLPHSTNRHFFVGIHKNFPRRFEKPQIMTDSIETIAKQLKKKPWYTAPLPGYIKGTGQVLAETIAPYETESPNDAKQKFYNSWITRWCAEHHMSMLPNIPSKQTTDAPKSEADSWLEAGFLGPRVVEETPSLDEVKDTSFKPRITFAALAAAQGFPPEWQFQAERQNERLAMIQAALPPVIARMVGLAVRSALTGEVFDLDSEVKVPVIDTSKIGPQRAVPAQSSRSGALRLNASRRRGPTPVDLLPRGDLYEKAVRVLRGEYLNEVERNHKRRAGVRRAMVLVKEEWRRDEKAERVRRELEDIAAWEASPHWEEAPD